MTNFNFLTFLMMSFYPLRDESEVVIHANDAFAPVAFLQFKTLSLRQKEVRKQFLILMQKGNFFHA